MQRHNYSTEYYYKNTLKLTYFHSLNTNLKLKKSICLCEKWDVGHVVYFESNIF